MPTWSSTTGWSPPSCWTSARPRPSASTRARSPGGPPSLRRRSTSCSSSVPRGAQTVVRLKGGDPFVFGRGGEEVLACAAAGVAVEVVPGVTSATAAPAAAGVPVTHRDVARSFAVITASTAHGDGTPDLGPVSEAVDTLVLLMAAGRLPEICADARRGRPPRRRARGARHVGDHARGAKRHRNAGGSARARCGRGAGPARDAHRGRGSGDPARGRGERGDVRSIVAVDLKGPDTPRSPRRWPRSRRVTHPSSIYASSPCAGTSTT